MNISITKKPDDLVPIRDLAVGEAFVYQDTPPDNMYVRVSDVENYGARTLQNKVLMVSLTNGHLYLSNAEARVRRLKNVRITGEVDQ